MGAMHFAPTLLGPSASADLLVTGRVVAAREALAMGLVGRVCEDPVGEALRLAGEVCQAAPKAVRTTVELLRRRQDAVGLGLEESMRADASAQAATYNTRDLAEGVQALRDRRPPNFDGH